MFRFYFELEKWEEGEAGERKEEPKDLLQLWEEARVEHYEDVSVFDSLENDA